MPKIDLHRHLEGSLRLETLFEIAKDFKLDLPIIDIENLRPLVQMTANDPVHYESFLNKFKVLRQFYLSPEIIKRMAYEAVADAAADNVKYLELRFSPQALARAKGFSLENVTDWVIDATSQASKDFKIKLGLIVTLVRHETIEESWRTADIAFDRYKNGIVGIDLAGDEVKYPPLLFQSIFDKAKDLGIGITVHAGEWAGPESVRNAIENLNANRIGHGVRSIENSEIVNLLKAKNITLEICLTSNLQTGVVERIENHQIKHLINSGIRVTLNTDDPGVSNLTLSDEYILAVEKLGFDYVLLRRLIMNAANASFLEGNEKLELANEFEKLLD